MFLISTEGCHKEKEKKTIYFIYHKRQIVILVSYFSSSFPFRCCSNATQTPSQRRDETSRGGGALSPTQTGFDSLRPNRHSSNSVGGGFGHQGHGIRSGTWAASLSTSDLEQLGGGGSQGGGKAPSISSFMSGSSGGQSSVGAPMVEGIDLTSLNGGGPSSHDRNGSNVIIKPLLADNGQEFNLNSSPWYQNGGSSVSQASVDRYVSDESSLGNARYPDGLLRQDQQAIEEEEENEGDDLFKPSGEDTFFQVKRKQALDDINSVLDASENHETLLPSVREQVLGNGLMDDSGLPMISASPSSPESRTFKLVKSVAQASNALSPDSSQDYSGEEEGEETTGTKSTSSSASPQTSADFPLSPGEEKNGELKTTPSPAVSPQSDLAPLPAAAECDSVTTGHDGQNSIESGLS